MKTVQLVIEKVENATMLHEIVFEGVAADGSPVTKQLTSAHMTKPSLIDAISKASDRLVSKNSLGDEQ